MRVLAIDMGGTFIKYAICEVNMNNGDIKFLKKDRFRTTTEENPYGTEVVEDMAKFVSKILKKHPEVKCICGSIGGVIDDEKYQVLSSHHKFQDYHMVNIKHIFDKYTKLPIYIMNDVKAGGLGELRYGSLKKYHKHANAIFMAIGTGIAMVSIINGKLHLGYEYAAGEIAGMVINNHYYENHYALPYLIKRCQALDPDLITAEDCLRAAKKHKQIKNMIDAWFVGLVEGVTTMTYILNPKYFIFGGKITEDKYFNLKTFKDLMLSNCRQPALSSIKNVKLIKAKLGNDAALYGAASLAFNRDWKL